MSSGRKVLLLTGASRGIGHATVKRFGEAGWRVITCSREDVPQECLRDPAWSHHIVADLGDTASLQHFLASALAALDGGKLDALVNNAGVSPKTRSQPLEIFDCFTSQNDLECHSGQIIARSSGIVKAPQTPPNIGAGRR